MLRNDVTTAVSMPGGEYSLLCVINLHKCFNALWNLGNMSSNVRSIASSTTKIYVFCYIFFEKNLIQF